MTTPTLLVNLKPGDRIQLGDEVLEVANVDACAAFVIVDFTDATATPPKHLGTWAEVIRP